jgi:hypothetical protein
MQTHKNKVNRMFTEIDAVVDPKPSNQFVQRIRGEIKEQPPPATKSLQGRARRWMIDGDWLANHPEFDLPMRIADSGKLWGDMNDPEETAALIKRSAGEKAELKSKKKSKAIVVDDSDTEKGSTKKRKRNKKGKAKASSSRHVEVESDNDMEDLYDST